MFKLGFAILFVVFFACNYCRSSPAAFQEKQKHVISEDAGPRRPSEEDDGGFAQDAVYDNDEIPKDAPEDKNSEVDDDDSEGRYESKREDEIVPRSRKRRYRGIVRCKRTTYPGSRTVYSCCPIEVTPSASEACCGSRTYDVRRYVCCGDTIHHKPSGNFLCCGTRPYSPQSQMCCSETVQRKPSGSPACCETQSYDSRECLCCDGNVRRKPAGIPRCCGTKAFNAQSQTCCGAQSLHPGSSYSHSCCGGQPYNFYMFMCLGNGNIVPMPRGAPIK